MFSFFKTWTIFPPWDNRDLKSHFSSLNAVFKLEGKIISRSSQSEIFSQQIDGKTYFVKRYFRSKGFASWLGFSRLQVEARNQQWFNKMQIPAAAVVVYGEERCFLKTQRGVLITEGIDDVTDLDVIGQQDPQKFQNATWCDALILRLANVVRTLHQNHFCHNDLHWRNILVQEGRGNSGPKIYLIDCPSGKRLFWPFLHYRKLKDLASLDKFAPSYLSRTQRLRFFLAYRQVSKLAGEDKSMVSEILAHKANRLKRKARSQAR